MIRRAKIVGRAAVLTLVLFVVAALAVSAAAPNAFKGTAKVDGSAAEWGTPLDGTNPSWFTGMDGGFHGCTPADCTSNLFLRYDPCQQILYALDYVTPGSTIDTKSAQFIAETSAGNKIVTDGSGNTLGVYPQFQFVGTQGWEMAVKLTPGNYSLWFEATVCTNSTCTTSGPNGKFIPVTLGGTCDPSAVTLSSMSAQSVDSGMGWALAGLGALGIVTLGGVLFVIARKR